VNPIVVYVTLQTAVKLQIGERGFAVIDMGNNGKIADVFERLSLAGARCKGKVRHGW
jgi:hypothetical protein